MSLIREALGAVRNTLHSHRKASAARNELKRTRVELAQSHDYSFTADWMSGRIVHWRQDLERFAGRPGVHMLEIGSYEGRSSVWFLENILTHPTARLDCVDPFFDPRCEVRFDHNIALCGAQQRVHKRKGTSEAVLPQLQGQIFDVIYIDGSHDGPPVLFDAMLSWELLKPGGVLLFDDYEWEPQLPPEKRPALAIDLFLGCHAGKYDVLRRGYQIVIAKKQQSS